MILFIAVKAKTTQHESQSIHKETQRRLQNRSPEREIVCDQQEEPPF
jgi:hypothetical protein